MLHPPKTGHQIYEVAIYNQEVRNLVKENQSHQYFDDQWADIQLRDIVAKDETEARELIGKRFPPDDGFIVEDVHLTSAPFCGK